MACVDFGAQCGPSEFDSGGWPSGRPGRAMNLCTVDARVRETLYLLQTIHKPSPLFYDRPYDHGPFFAAVLPTQTLENEYFSVARAACVSPLASERKYRGRVH